MTLSALMSHDVIRKHLKPTNGVYLYYHWRSIKSECTFGNIIYKTSIYEERGRRGNTSSSKGCCSMSQNNGSILLKELLFCKEANKVHTVGMLYCYSTSLTAANEISVLIVLLPDLIMKGLSRCPLPQKLKYQAIRLQKDPASAPLMLNTITFHMRTLRGP